MSFARIVGAWLLLAIAMIANGAFRELLLKPSLGANNAEILSAILGIAIILIITRVALRRLAGASASALFRVSALLVGLTLAFEFLFGRYVDRMTVERAVAPAHVCGSHDAHPTRRLPRWA
jgi:hypothetical protein